MLSNVSHLPYEAFINNQRNVDKGISMNSNAFKQIGNNILRVLEERQWSQQFLADKLKISKQVMSKIVSGNKATNVVEISKIANVLRVSVDTLVQVSEVAEINPVYSFMGQISRESTKEKILKLEEVIGELILLERFSDA
jgi:transcriptional regulator with XRE-family HTH domain